MPIDDVVISDDTDVSAQAEQAELAGIVQEMLAQLPEQDRELLLRFYFYRQSVREIAGEMHMKESTVKTRMYRSRKKLRQLFTERVMAMSKWNLFEIFLTCTLPEKTCRRSAGQREFPGGLSAAACWHLWTKKPQPACRHEVTLRTGKWDGFRQCWSAAVRSPRQRQPAAFPS